MRILKGNRMTNPDERLDLSDYPSPIEQRDEEIRNLKAENDQLKKVLSKLQTDIEILRKLVEEIP